MDNDEFQGRSERFLTWLRAQGATISSKIQLADLRQNGPFGSGRGVVATENLAEDEELFTIPRSTVLTVETSSLPSAALKDIFDPWLSLIVAMAYEHLRGVDSPFKSYFDVLPTSFDSLMYWSETDLSHLEGSAVVDKIGKESADTTFTEQLIPVLGQHANTGTLNNEQLLALCHRMASTIMSYAFDLEKSSTNPSKNEEDGWEEDSDDDGELLPKGMVPLADMLNADADRNNAKLFYEDDKVVMKTIKAVESGEELFNDYGPLPRADVLRRYGYVTDNYAQYDVVEIPADTIRDKAKKLLNLSANDLDEKWKYAEEQGVLDDAYDIGHAGSEGGQFPKELCVLLNLVATAKVEFEKLKKKDKLPKPELSNDAKKLLRTVLVHRYAMYRPDPDEMEVDEAGAEGRRRAMALQVIDGERAILQEAVSAVSDAALGKKRSANTLEDEAAAIRNPGKK
ncbi:SET domain-containing protein [Zymoseptoria brevis]|uniref:Ribosomal lysine N-methyltransferase 4 n=1 Tax=Zymoseptoria brevis TaxID=1047168 RepID=A0A0F4GRK8_9PEZI|nr:SET domain-containing protein [Zymoseptoria brevis]